MVMHQHRHYGLWSIGAGILLPLLIGVLTGHLLGAFLLAVCTRLTLVYHGTFCINSVCHMFGKATYDIYSSAKDHWFAAILTFGEGYHNYHHHFPADYRNGVRWYHWDPTKWMITILAWLGLAHNLKKISQYKIIAARLRAKHQRTDDVLREAEGHPKLEALRQSLKGRYEGLKKMLVDWEQRSLEYRDIVRQRVVDSKSLAVFRLKKLRMAQQRFKASLRKWEILHSSAIRTVCKN